MENFIVAFSNLPVLLPIRESWKQGDTLTATTIGFVGLASFISHLAENHKHGMPGIGLSKQVSYFLNRLDVLGCFLTGTRLGYLYYMKHGITIYPIAKRDIICASFAFLLLKISECDKYNSKLKWIYIPLHSLWHISIFMIMNRFVKVYI